MSSWTEQVSSFTKSIGTSETPFRLSWIIADDFSLRLCTSWSKFRLPEHSKGDLAFADGVARGDRCTAVRVTRIMLTCIGRRLVGLRRAAHPRQRLGLRSACVGHVEMRPVQHGLRPLIALASAGRVRAARARLQRIAVRGSRGALGGVAASIWAAIERLRHRIGLHHAVGYRHRHARAAPQHVPDVCATPNATRCCASCAANRSLGWCTSS